jgi:hypothetical protein
VRIRDGRNLFRIMSNGSFWYTGVEPSHFATTELVMFYSVKYRKVLKIRHLVNLPQQREYMDNIYTL